MNVRAYLDRIAYHGPTTADQSVLCALHRAHMFTVPFENLDIHLNRPILCDEDRILRKIINERRGGFCYELNAAFAALLRALGFRVTMLSARVFHDDGSEGPDFDHMALIVDLERPWLADVGFGDSFVEPLLLQPGLEQEQYGRRYRIAADSGRFRYESQSDNAWKPQYSFGLQPRHLLEFATMCDYQQTSPDSHFTRNTICSLATPDGRITLRGETLIVTRNGKRGERTLSDEERRNTLLDRFGVNLRT